PNSIYSKLIRNPNYYRDTKIANKQAEADYRSVYELYKDDKFTAADSVASIIITKYPDSDILDKLTYIKILCKIKSGEPIEKTMEEIKAFNEQFPESTLLPLVDDLSKAIEKQSAQANKNEQADEPLQEKDLQPGDANNNNVPDLNVPPSTPQSLEKK
ncbi:MAG TPA: hypothetical protein VK796_01165, partial [Cytophaga sp.]|nr:hypothetical protein [Cytophaga sp.]